MKVIIKKNKGAPPFRRVQFDIIFGEGISRVGEIVDLGVGLKIIEKSGSWYSYNGSKIAQGKEATKNTLRDNPELCEELTEKIFEALRSGAVPALPEKSDKKS